MLYYSLVHAIRRPEVQVLPWPLAGFVTLGSLEFKSSAMLVKQQIGSPLASWDCWSCYVTFKLFFSLSLKSPKRGEDNESIIIIIIVIIIIIIIIIITIIINIY